MDLDLDLDLVLVRMGCVGSSAFPIGHSTSALLTVERHGCIARQRRSLGREPHCLQTTPSHQSLQPPINTSSPSKPTCSLAYPPTPKLDFLSKINTSHSRSPPSCAPIARPCCPFAACLAVCCIQPSPSCLLLYPSTNNYKSQTKRSAPTWPSPPPFPPTATCKLGQASTHFSKP